MPRIRSVHPDLHRDRTLAQVSASAERTFVRLWCHLDDEGRGEDDPDLLKADLYPRHRDMTPEAIEADLVELADNGLIVRYRVAGVAYLACKPETWSQYQRPQKKQDSKLPGIDQADPVPNQSEGTTEPVRNRSDTATRLVLPVGEGRGEGVVGEGIPPVGNGEPFATTLANELKAEHGWKPPEGATLHQSFQALLREALELLPAERHRNITMGLIGNFAAKAEVELTTEARSHTARLVSTHPADAVLSAWNEAIQWGAGIGGEYVDDPLALSKYAAKVLTGKRAA